LSEALIRFLIGGLVVSAFATVGGLFKPTSFAGLFGASPSVALATLALTVSKSGTGYASIECRSMMAGAAALCLYSLLVSQLLTRFRLSALTATFLAMPLWFLTVFALWLFLVFPAIFPASATLIEKHERQRKQEKGLRGQERGIDAAAVDAMGAALGSVALRLSPASAGG
jgi:hypothetical protein